MVYCVCVITASGMCGVTKLLVGDIKTYVGEYYILMLLHLLLCARFLIPASPLFSAIFSQDLRMWLPLHPYTPPTPPPHTHTTGDINTNVILMGTTVYPPPALSIVAFCRPSPSLIPFFPLSLWILQCVPKSFCWLLYCLQGNFQTMKRCLHW